MSRTRTRSFINVPWTARAQPTHYASGAPLVAFSKNPSAQLPKDAPSTSITSAYARAHPWLLSLSCALARDPAWTRVPTSHGELCALRGPRDATLVLPGSATAFFESGSRWREMFGSEAFACARAAYPLLADIVCVLQYMCRGLVLVAGEDLPPQRWRDDHCVDLRRMWGMPPAPVNSYFSCRIRE